MKCNNTFRAQYCLLLAAFLLIFPLLQPVASGADKKKAEVDLLDVFYKKAELLGGHTTPESSLALINQLISSGHLNSAREIFEKAPALPQSFQAQKSITQLRLETAEYFRIAEQGETKNKKKERVRTLLLELSSTPDLNNEELRHLEQQAEQFDVGEGVVAFARQLAEADTENSSKWWYKAGEWNLIKKTYQEAIDSFQKAFNAAQSNADRQKYMMALLRALRDGQQYAEVANEIESVINTTTHADTLENLAIFSLQVERPDLAWQLYAKLYCTNFQDSDQWLGETVTWAIAAGQPLEAAAFLDECPHENFTPKQINSRLHSLFSLMRSGNNLEGTLNIAQEIINKPPTNAVFLEQGIQAALVAGNIALASTWNDLLLDLTPNNRSLLKRQVDLALAGQDLAKAVKSIRKTFQLDQENKEVERQLAQLEEWDGNPGVALTHWRHLLHTAVSVENAEQVFRLSKMLKEQTQALRALEIILQHRPLTPPELKDQIGLYEILGEPEKGIESTVRHLEKYPEDFSGWLELAHLQMRSREYARAAQTWEQIAFRFGRSKEETLFRSECYWRLGKKKTALEVMESYQGDLSGIDNLYHANLLVELGWRYRRPELARHSFDSLLEHYNEKKFFVLERIIYLQRDAGNQDQAIAFAIRSAEETEDPRFLMLALNLAVASLDEEKITSLLEKMDASADSFDSVPLYWIIQAQKKYTEGDYRTAELLYQKAIKLDTGSITAKEGILWSLLSLGDKKRLAEQLDAWQSQAIHNQELWLVYALCRHNLGQYQQAWTWYEKLVSSGNTVHGILLGYADVLEAAGAKDRAFRLRMHTMQQQRKKAADFIQNPGVLTETIQSYVALMHRYGSTQQGEYWLKLLQHLEQGKASPPWMYDFAISWYLKTKRYDKAKRWLLQAHEQRIKVQKMLVVTLVLETDKPEEIARLLEAEASFELEQKDVALAQAHEQRIKIQKMEVVSLALEGGNPEEIARLLEVGASLDSKQKAVPLAKAHEQRIKVQKVQVVTLALEGDNPKEIARLLEAGTSLDFEQKAVAFEKLDRRQEALQTAQLGITQRRGYDQRSTARMLAASLKTEYPDYWNIGYDSIFSDQLESQDAHIGGRFSLEDKPVSLATVYRYINYSSSIYMLDGHDKANDLALSASIGHGKMGGSATFGLNHHDADDIGYGFMEFHRQLTDGILAQFELAIHAVPDVDSILQPASLQNRLDATLIGTLASHYYYYLDIWGREYSTREGNDIAKGYGATTEVGFKQHWGRFEWLAGIQGNFEHNFDREIPDDLKPMLPTGYGVDNVIVKEATSVLIGGRIGRGAIREEYPVTGSIRYFSSAYLGHTWPQNKLATYLKAGWGTRILGNDELSIELHYNQSGEVVGRNDDSGISGQYRYHF